MGGRHADAATEADDADFVGWYDINPDAGAGRARGMRYDTLADLVRDCGLVVIATPTESRLEVCHDLPEAVEVMYLLEKPLAAGLDAAAEVCAELKAHQSRVSVGYVERFNPALRVARDWLAALTERGDLVTELSTVRLGPYPAHRGGRDVDLLPDLGTHDFDLTGWLLGATYTSVDAHAAGGDADGVIEVRAALSGGVQAVHTIGWTGGRSRRLVLRAKTSAFAANLLTGRVRITGEGGLAHYHQYDGPTALRGQLSALCAARAATDIRPADLSEALSALEVAAASLESLRTGAEVELGGIYDRLRGRAGTDRPAGRRLLRVERSDCHRGGYRPPTDREGGAWRQPISP
jgi:predicted dehydrogenase